jgi:beta-glucanase (GH16 family)
MKSNPWLLVWQDEFDGSEIDRTKWHLDVGYTGASNEESQIYTDRPENVRLENGCLIIEARKEAHQGFEYTSARVHTENLHAWEFGRIEARIRIPSGQGLWPAFWMLGVDRITKGWPECGEIDIMENIGKQPQTVRGTIHGPGYFRDDSIGKDFHKPGEEFANDFHRYAVEWEPNQIRWFVDQSLYNTLTPNDVPGKWVFDHPFYILLNMAVGGVWPGYPDETTTFPQFMHVDYVRVYARKS